MSIAINEFCQLTNTINTFEENGILWLQTEDVYRALHLRPETFDHRHFLAQNEWDTITCENWDEFAFISESGFYKMMFQTQEDSVCMFLNWVVQIVLPCIYHDGMYIMGEEESFPQPDTESFLLHEMYDRGATGVVFREKLTRVILPELRRDGSYFRGLRRKVLVDSYKQGEMQADIASMVKKKATRREQLKHNTH